MVHKSEELRESGTAPYSDVPCAVVPLASTSLTLSDWTTPNCIHFSCCCCSSTSACYHTHTVQSIISPHIHYRFHHLHAVTYYVGWAYFRVLCNSLQWKWRVGTFPTDYGTCSYLELRHSAAITLTTYTYVPAAITSTTRMCNSNPYKEFWGLVFDNSWLHWLDSPSQVS